MTNWRRHWNRFPRQVRAEDYLTQVGHTLGGQPYSDEVFERMVAGIGAALTLGEDDHLLDLCCGNGVITSRLAVFCASAVGVDFSEPLLEIANAVHRPHNLTYLNLDVNDLATLRARGFPPFSRVLMYGALQHLPNDGLAPLLRNLLPLTTDRAKIMIGGIPNRRHRERFMASTSTRIKYHLRRLTGRDRIGTWWLPRDIQAECAQLGLQCTIDDSSDHRPGGHYRFDALITR